MQKTVYTLIINKLYLYKYILRKIHVEQEGQIIHYVK